jgi:hypothetical protein
MHAKSELFMSNKIQKSSSQNRTTTVIDSLNDLSCNDFSAIVEQVKGLNENSEKKRN